MRLQLNEHGMIPADYPKTFYRVETWATGYHVADFTNEAEAAEARRDEALMALIQAYGQLNVEYIAAISRGEIDRSTRIGKCLKQVDDARRALTGGE